jgi:hypothetical protein
MVRSGRRTSSYVGHVTLFRSGRCSAPLPLGPGKRVRRPPRCGRVFPD